VSKLKEQKLGYRSLQSVDYHLNMVVGQSALTRQQDPLSIFELTIDENDKSKLPEQEKIVLEFDHSELYSFFTQLERMQQQLDSLAK
jgi:COMM domain containing 10